MGEKAQLTLRQMEDLVAELRSRWAMKFAHPLDLLHVLRTEMPRMFVGFRLIVLPDAQMKHRFAYTTRDLNSITVAEGVIRAAAQFDRKALLILAEEIAHYVLKHKGTRFRKLDQSNHIKPRNARSDEQQAQRFAFMLIAPEYMISDSDDVWTIQKKFGFSKQIATFRLHEIQEVRNERSGTIRQTPQAIVDFLKKSSLRGLSSQQEPHHGDQIELNLNVPDDVFPIVDIDNPSERSVYLIWGYTPEGEFKNIELKGSKKGYRLPFNRSKIIVRAVSGRLPTKIIATDFLPLERAESPKINPEIQMAVIVGYDKEPCPDGHYKVVRDGNSKTCTACFWTSSTTG